MTRPPLVTICPSFTAGTGMEQNAVRGCCQVKAAHGIAFLIRFGIPAADQHYAGSRARVEFHCLGVEVYLVHAFEQFYNVALDAQHDTFGFRVAHTYIVFDNHRLVLYIDKSQENETFCTEQFSNSYDVRRRKSSPGKVWCRQSL